MVRFITIISVCLGLGVAQISFAPSVRADDTAATLAAGGLVPVRTTTVSMAEEDLRISPAVDPRTDGSNAGNPHYRIDVNYRFRNDTDHDVKTLIEFPLPVRDLAYEAHSEIEIPNPDRENFVGFSVTADGEPVQAKLQTKAVLNGKDVTHDLAIAGIHPWNSGMNISSILERMPTATRKKLLDHGLFGSDTNNESDPYPAWEVHSAFYWDQVFPAHGDVTISHSYAPVAGGQNTFQASSISSGKFCALPAQRAAVRAMIANDPKTAATLSDTDIGFVLLTGNNWQGPIGKFTLTVTTASHGDIPLTCFGALDRVSNTRYQMILTRFHPSKDLDIDILNVAR